MAIFAISKALESDYCVVQPSNNGKIYKISKFRASETVENGTFWVFEFTKIVFT